MLFNNSFFEISVVINRSVINFSAVDFDDYESLQYFQRVLIHTGVIDALREAGIQEGDTVSMYDLEFDFVN